MPKGLAIPSELLRRDFWTVREVCDLYGISRTALYDAFKAGAPRTRRVHRVTIDPKIFHAWVCKNRSTWVMPFFKEEREDE